MEKAASEDTHQAVFEAREGEPGMRLDVFWSSRLGAQDVSRARIQAAIEAGQALVDGQPCRKPGYRLRRGERLSLALQRLPSAATAEAGELGVLFRDESLLVLDKPAGLTVHPAPGLAEGTLVNRLVHHFPELRAMPGLRPGIVHRLDKDTSGLLLVALSEPVRLALSADFAARRVSKTYLALVHGRPQADEDCIDLPLGRDPDNRTKMAVVKKGGREAKSRYRLAWTAPNGLASLLEVAIATGRTHQIRVHLAAIGHPIVGDAVYGPRQHADWKRRGGPLARLAGRQMLHSWKLSFRHPILGRKLDFCRPPPRDFWRLLLLLGRRTQRVGLVGAPGCGKSTLLAVFAAAGHPVFSADAAVAELYGPGGDGAHVLSRRFGQTVLAADGSVDKAWLLREMLDSERSRREVMDLVHPLVKNRLEAFFAAHAAARAAFAEVPLLLEAGWSEGDVVDMVIGVRCPSGARRERLVQGRGWPEELMDRMDAWQWPEAKKLARCRYVAENAGDVRGLAVAGKRILDALARERRQEALARYRELAARGYAGPSRACPESQGKDVP